MYKVYFLYFGRECSSPVRESLEDAKLRMIKYVEMGFVDVYVSRG